MDVPGPDFLCGNVANLPDLNNRFTGQSSITLDRKCAWSFPNCQDKRTLAVTVVHLSWMMKQWRLDCHESRRTDSDFRLPMQGCVESHNSLRTKITFHNPTFSQELVMSSFHLELIYLGTKMRNLI
jgi:hypothetical protein